MKTDWFLKHSGKILKLSAREMQEQVTTLLCNWVSWSLCGKPDGLKLKKKIIKKIASSSSKGFKLGEITNTLEGSAVDSKLPSLFNLSVPSPHALTWPFIQPRLGWHLCYLPGKELFFAAPSLIHFEKRIKYSLWPSIQAC